jgi:2-keto-4-pentenoate hydratase/2-oxohepta-3-ene-1,7-dioic acid hydratase in catechol pathway
MRIANFDGRACLVTDEGLCDIAHGSEGRFSSESDVLVGQLGELNDWLKDHTLAVTEDITPEQLLGDERLGPVVTRPSQVFAVGLNYREHARETGATLPTKPMIFTKFPSSVGSANSMFPVPSARLDWEAELVVVIGTAGRDIREDDALSHVGGYCVGNDLSDRELQQLGSPAQFSLGKSYQNFAPVGPWLTSADEIADPNALTISSSVNGDVMQNSNTADMVFNVKQLVSYISSVCELRPGDLIFTGTPQGVGQARTPPIFLGFGDVVEIEIEKLGSLRNMAIDAL